MARLENLSFVTSVSLGLLLQPWPLVGAGVATVAEMKVDDLEQALFIAAFCVLATSTLLVMEIYVVLSPAPSRAHLRALRVWIESHQNQTVTFVALGVGLWLISQSLYGLVTAWLVAPSGWCRPLTSLALILTDFTALVVPACNGKPTMRKTTPSQKK